MTYMSDFKKRTLDPQIVLRVTDDNWGPFEFDCSPGLPDGITINDATATCYMSSSGVEVSSLIEPGSISILNGMTVSLAFQVGPEVIVGDYYLALVLSLSNGGTKKLIFGLITVEEL